MMEDLKLPQIGGSQSRESESRDEEVKLPEINDREKKNSESPEEDTEDPKEEKESHQKEAEETQQSNENEAPVAKVVESKSKRKKKHQKVDPVEIKEEETKEPDQSRDTEGEKKSCLPSITDPSGFTKYIERKFKVLQKKEIALKKLVKATDYTVFDHRMLPRINPTKSNLISRLDPYTVEQGHQEMTRINKSIPSDPDSDHGYRYRKTAVDMLDPWEFLDLDSMESSRKTIPRYTGGKRHKRDYPNRPPPQGSTYYPKFPNVNYPYFERGSPTRIVPLDDVPKVRQKLKKDWSKRSPERMRKDYTKTKNDFYRMELDKLQEMRPTYNRPSMVNTYNAYLQNTPGSKQALDECISGIEARLLRDNAGVGRLPKQKVPGKKNSSRSSTRQKLATVETPSVDMHRKALQSAG